MYSDDLIPPNTSITLKFTVDNNYHLNVLRIAGSSVCSLATGGAINYAISKLVGASTFATPNANNFNTTGVGIVDMNFFLRRVHMPNIVSDNSPLRVKQFTSILHPITAGTHDEFNVDFFGR